MALDIVGRGSVQDALANIAGFATLAPQRRSSPGSRRHGAELQAAAQDGEERQAQPANAA